VNIDVAEEARARPGVAAYKSSKLVENATLKVYEGGPHGLADKHKYRLNADLLDFLRE